MRRDVFQAIADPTRREIIHLIAHQTLTPNAVADSFDISRQAISKHIKILTECGILVIKQEGRERFYSVQPKKLNEVSNWLSAFQKIWDDRFDRLDTLLNKMKSTHKTRSK
jgi:DNA-binding transcriptional ArsR family regulator